MRTARKQAPALLAGVAMILCTLAATAFGSPGPMPVGEDAIATREIKGVGARIVGGMPTQVQEFQWLVNLYDTRLGLDGFCGGTLVSANWVVTAAHCLVDYNTASERQELRVSIGRHNSDGSASPPPAHPIEDIGVDAVLMHEGYNEVSLVNDVALLKLSRSALPHWKAVDSLGMPSADIVGETLTVAGWGTTESQGSPPLVAHKVNVEGTSCSAYGNDIFAGMICAADDGKDSCQGDSGGPLVHKSADNHTLVGVVSWGFGCAAPEYPGVYADVDYFRPWICKTMEENTGSGDLALHPSCSGSTYIPCTGCTGCGTYTGASWAISDGSGSSDYPNNALCEWTFTTSDSALNAKITFSAFELENDPRYDHVKIYSCTDSTCSSMTLIETLYGDGQSNVGVAIEGTTNVMRVEFKSDGSEVFDGFSATFGETSASPPPVELPPPHVFEGVFLSSTDQKWYAVAAGSKSSGFTNAKHALLWLPSLCADSHWKCSRKLNNAWKRNKFCPRARGWNSQKCAATCGPELGGCSPA